MFVDLFQSALVSTGGGDACLTCTPLVGSATLIKLFTNYSACSKREADEVEKVAETMKVKIPH